MRIPRCALAVACAAWLLSACVANGTTPSALPATQTASAEQQASPTQKAPDTPIPPTAATPTRTEPAPTGLNPEGPYALFEGRSGIWITNPDGTLPTRIADQGMSPAQDLRAALSPGGDRLALAAETEKGLDLLLIGLPDGETTAVTRLVTVTRVERMLNSLSPESFAYNAITEYPGLAWRPGDVELLAYIGGGVAPNADLYTYDPAGKSIRRAESDPSQAVHPMWSPRGEYLLFFGINWLPPFGVTYVTFDPMAGFWALRLSDNLIIPQEAPEGTPRNVLGWRDGSHYVAYDSDSECPVRDLRAVDAAGGDSSPLVEGCLHTRPALAPENGAILLSVDAGSEAPLDEGLFLILPDSPSPIRLSEKAAFELSWLPESGMFYAYPQGLYGPDGDTRLDPPNAGSSYRPAVSSAGAQAWEVVEDKRHFLKIREPGGDWQTVMEGDIGAMVWDPLSGDTLLVAFESGELYSVSAPDFTPQPIDILAGPIERAAWIPA